MAFVPRYLHGQSGVVVFVSYTQSRPRLGLAVWRFGGPIPRRDTHPGVRGFCHWAGELTAAKPPSRRADGPPSAQARKRQESELALSTPTPKTVRDVPRECEVRTQDSAESLLSPPLISHRPLTRTLGHLFAVARATKVCRRNHNQSDTVFRAIDLARSDHPTATGESEPLVTLPRASSPAIMRYQQPTGTHSPELPGDRRDRHKREPRLGPRRPTSPKDRAKSEPQGPLQARGVPGDGRSRPSRARFGHKSSRIIIPRHDFCDFDHPFPSQDGPPEKTFQLGSGSSQRDVAKSAVLPM